MNDREVDNKVFSYLVETTEDRVLHICYATFRRMARNAVGASRFGHLPAKYRDTGAFVYDGQAVEARDGLDMEAALRQAEADLASQGIEYTLDLKPFHGRQDEPMESVKKAREALAEATAEVKEVREAMEGGARKKTPLGPKKPRAAAEGEEHKAAFVVLVRAAVEEESTVLLPLERRNRVERLGLLGGKAKAADGANSLVTAAREAYEETNKMMSKATRDSIAGGCSMWGQAWHGQSKARVFVHELGEEDLDLDTRWPEGLQLKTDEDSATVHLGLRWVPIGRLLDAQWRTSEMHPHSAMLVASASGVLRRGPAWACE